ncbi:MAG TPA: endo-1,4-beta-xylanase [Stellaceae bacterium]|jgi:endo-1,4-beta-xylanase|nr:endo-1,4-beta-xylanase [Stellaceae bacterium]
MAHLSRRGLLLGAAACGAGRTAFAAEETAGGLRKIAAERGLSYGSYIDLDDPDNSATLRIVAPHECDLMVAGMDWKYVAPTRDCTDFSFCDADYAWSRAHDMKLRGHALVWGEKAPGWFSGLASRAEAQRALEDHVTVMCRHFAGRMTSWDVVNEAILISSGRRDKLRPQVFLEKLGPDYIDIAFRAARASDPAARLVYNDFGVEVDTSEQNEKRGVLLDLLDGLRKRGVPIDAVGLQSHLYYELMPHFNDKQFSGFLSDLASRGFEIIISELDVVDRGAPSDIAKRDAEVAAIYRHYLDVVLDNRAVKTVITWGLSDRESWISKGVDPLTRRSDGLPPRPLPFDNDYLPKPAYFAMADAFRAAPRR